MRRRPGPLHLLCDGDVHASPGAGARQVVSHLLPTCRVPHLSCWTDRRAGQNMYINVAVSVEFVSIDSSPVLRPDGAKYAHQCCGVGRGASVACNPVTCGQSMVSPSDP